MPRTKTIHTVETEKMYTFEKMLFSVSQLTTGLLMTKSLCLKDKMHDIMTSNLNFLFLAIC